MGCGLSNLNTAPVIISPNATSPITSNTDISGAKVECNVDGDACQSPMVNYSTLHSPRLNRTDTVNTESTNLMETTESHSDLDSQVEIPLTKPTTKHNVLFNRTITNEDNDDDDDEDVVEDVDEAADEDGQGENAYHLTGDDGFHTLNSRDIQLLNEENEYHKLNEPIKKQQVNDDENLIDDKNFINEIDNNVNAVGHIEENDQNILIIEPGELLNDNNNYISVNELDGAITSTMRLIPSQTSATTADTTNLSTSMCREQIQYDED